MKGYIKIGAGTHEGQEGLFDDMLEVEDLTNED